MKTFKQMREEQAKLATEAHSDEAEDKKLIDKEISAKVKPDALKSGGGEKPAFDKSEKPEGDEEQEEKVSKPPFGEGKDAVKNLAQEFAKTSFGRAAKMRKDAEKKNDREEKKGRSDESTQVDEKSNPEDVGKLVAKANRAHVISISKRIEAEKKRRKEEQESYESSKKKKTNEGIDERSAFEVPAPKAASRKGTYGTSHKADDADHKADEPTGDSKVKHSADALANAMNMSVKASPSDRHMKQAKAGFVKGVSVRQHTMQDEAIEYFIVKEGVAYHYVFEDSEGNIIATGRAPTENGAVALAERTIEEAIDSLTDTQSALEIAKNVARK